MYTCGAEKMFESAIYLYHQYICIHAFIQIFTILVLFETLFYKHVSDNSHVYFILSCNYDKIMPVCENIVLFVLEIGKHSVPVPDIHST